ncbi:MAG: helix-turn-helix domain-containing protein [Clostridium sp.]
MSDKKHYNENIINFFKEHRKEMKLTYRKFSEICGVSHQSISQYERGLRVPDIYATINIAKGLDVELLELIKLFYMDNK